MYLCIIKNDLKEILDNWPLLLLALYVIVMAIGQARESKRNIDDRIGSQIQKVNYDGHEYLMYDRGLTHSGNCKKCKENGSN